MGLRFPGSPWALTLCNTRAPALHLQAMSMELAAAPDNMSDHEMGKWPWLVSILPRLHTDHMQTVPNRGRSQFFGGERHHGRGVRDW